MLNTRIRNVPLLAGFVLTSPVFSFPENVRLGYPSCASCHVDPLGGGVLTQYGQGSSSAYLVTFPVREEREEQSWAKYVDFGANLRTVHVKQDTSTGESRTNNLLMQAEFQGVGFLSDQVTVTASGGVYGEPFSELSEVRKTPEISTYYAVVKPQPFYFIRGGRFTPGFGLRLPDHTASVRSFVFPAARPQKEGADAGLLTGVGELSAGTFRDETGDFSVLRGVVYLSNFATLGGHFLSRQGETISGGFFSAGRRGFSALGELDFSVKPDGMTIIGYSKLSQEVVRGLHVYEVNDKVWAVGGTRPNRITLGLQWFPVEGEEISLELRNFERPIERTYVIMLHSYL